MEKRDELMAPFPEVSKQQWIAQATKDLKGAAFETLTYTTADGIRLDPFYTIEDTDAPEPLFAHTDWEICECIVVGNEAVANKQALDYLNGGATAIIFKVSQPIDLDVLLQDIGIEYIALQFEIYGDAIAFQQALDVYLSARKKLVSNLNITLNYDPIERLATKGNWASSEEATIAGYQDFAMATKGSRNVVVNGKIYHNSGATPGYEIGCILAHANEYLHWLGGDAMSAALQLNVAIGGAYFTEIAKQRALRKVFALLLHQYNCNDAVYIHATSAKRNLTIYDHYNNLLRTSTGAMAAVAGGCNSLRVLPYNIIYAQPDDFSERLARNTQLILKGESYFDKVSDVAAGSYFIEHLTEALAQKGWEYFQEIEANGGLLEGLKKGNIQQKISEFAEREQALFDEGKIVLVGTNKYAAPGQMMKEQVEVRMATNSPAESIIAPLRPTRLAEKIEAERLANENTELC